MKQVNGRKFTGKKKEKKKNIQVEEIQLANLASLGSLASNQSIAWYACEASLGKERYVLGSMNGKHRGVSVKYVSLIVSCHCMKVFITA